MGLKHQAAAARKWRSVIREVERHFPPHLPPLLFLTDPVRTPAPDEVARQLPPGSGVIYRHFGADDRDATAADLRAICDARDMTLLIGGDPRLARDVGADGVHWPEARLSEAKAWRGQFALQTASAHALHAIKRAACAGMDAALVSTVFPSRSPSAGRAIGPRRLQTYSILVDIPVYGLGGLNARNARQISGFSGIAAIGGFLD